jgi:hypothetical protein
MPEPEPRRVVPIRPSEPAAAPPRPERSPGRRTVWLLIALLAVALLAAGVQTRRAAELSGRVRELGLKLAGARAAIAAYERQRAEVRDSVDAVSSALADLDGRVGELRERASRDPLEGAAPADEPAAGR